MDYYQFWLTKLSYLDLMVELNNLNNFLEETEKESVKKIINQKLVFVIKRIEKIEKMEKLERETETIQG